MSSSKPSDQAIGAMRMSSDMRQIAALMMVAGFCAIIQPAASISGAIGRNTTVDNGSPLFGLIGGLCLMGIGIGSMFVGYNQVVHDWGNKNLTGALILFTQTAFIPYLTDIITIAKNARTGAAFIPKEYTPSEADVKFVGAIGVTGVLSHGFAFVGAISFMQFALYAYQAGAPQSRSGEYYAGRMGFYTFMLLIAGVGQLSLGAYISSNIGSGYLDLPITVAMYFVSFPSIQMVLGIFQIINALWGYARSKGALVFGDNDMSYQMSIFVQWLLQISLQAVANVAIVPGAGAVQATPTIIAVTFGLSLMPAFLDYKMRAVPMIITPSYYGLDEATIEEQTQKVNEEV